MRSNRNRNTYESDARSPVKYQDNSCRTMRAGALSKGILLLMERQSEASAVLSPERSKARWAGEGGYLHNRNDYKKQEDGG